MTLREFLEEIHFHHSECRSEECQNLNNELLDLELVLRLEAVDTHTLKDLDYRNVDHKTKTIQFITT